jgi:hypothetical protein
MAAIHSPVPLVGKIDIRYLVRSGLYGELQLYTIKWDMAFDGFSQIDDYGNSSMPLPERYKEVLCDQEPSDAFFAAYILKISPDLVVKNEDQPFFDEWILIVKEIIWMLFNSPAERRKESLLVGLKRDSVIAVLSGLTRVYRCHPSMRDIQLLSQDRLKNRRVGDLCSENWIWECATDLTDLFIREIREVKLVPAKACEFFTFAFPHFLVLREQVLENRIEDVPDEPFGMPALLAVQTMFSLIDKHLIKTGRMDELKYSLSSVTNVWSVNDTARQFSRILDSLTRHLSAEFVNCVGALQNVLAEMLLTFQTHITRPFVGMIDDDDVLRTRT